MDTQITERIIFGQSQRQSSTTYINVIRNCWARVAEIHFNETLEMRLSCDTFHAKVANMQLDAVNYHIFRVNDQILNYNVNLMLEMWAVGIIKTKNYEKKTKFSMKPSFGLAVYAVFLHFFSPFSYSMFVCG